MPVVIIHQSGHLASVNSKALELAGFTAQTKNPEGGVIRRKAGSQEPDGVLEELAFFIALGKLMPKLSPESAIAMLEKGQELYLRYGYTTIQDGRATPGNVKTAIAAATQKKLKADVVAYPDIIQPGSVELMTAPWYHDTTTGTDLPRPLPHRRRQADARRLAAGQDRVADPSPTSSRRRARRTTTRAMASCRTPRRSTTTRRRCATAGRS